MSGKERGEGGVALSILFLSQGRQENAHVKHELIPFFKRGGRKGFQGFSPLCRKRKGFSRKGSSARSPFCEKKKGISSPRLGGGGENQEPSTFQLRSGERRGGVAAFCQERLCRGEPHKKRSSLFPSGPRPWTRGRKSSPHFFREGKGGGETPLVPSPPPCQRQIKKKEEVSL